MVLGVWAKGRDMPDKRAFQLCAAAGLTSFGFVGLLLLVYPIQLPQGGQAVLPPALALQFALTPEHVVDIFGPPGTPLRKQVVADMQNGNRLDYAFMVIYGVFLALFFHAQRLKMDLRAWWSVLPMVVVAIVFDVQENGVLAHIARAPDDPDMAGFLNALHLFSWGKWSTLAVICGVAAMSFFTRGAVALGVLCLPPLLVIVPAYQHPGQLAVYLVLGVGLSWMVMLAHAIKRAFFQPPA